jgi:hypothetical protein
MVIAVNAIFFQDEKREGYGHYAWEIVSRLILTHPEHAFVLLFDKPFNHSFIIAPGRGMASTLWVLQFTIEYSPSIDYSRSCV